MSDSGFKPIFTEMHGFGFDEDSMLIPTDEMDFTAMDRRLFDVSNEELIAGMTQEETDRIYKLFNMLLRWLWQNGGNGTKRGARGIQLRTILMCWLFLDSVRRKNLQRVAKEFGLKERTLRHWHLRFRRDFPGIRLPLPVNKI